MDNTNTEISTVYMIVPEVGDRESGIVYEEVK
jgi:hypothetical protein